MHTFLLKFDARASISTGKCTVHISNITDHRALGLTAEPVHKYDFYIGSWMGMANPNMPYERLTSCPNGTGHASLT